MSKKPKFLQSLVITVVTLVCCIASVQCDQDKSHQINSIVIEELESRISRLERRLRAVEQPGNLDYHFLCVKEEETKEFIGHFQYNLFEKKKKLFNSLNWYGIVWQVGKRIEDWEVCAMGPCKCRPEMKSLSCWKHNLQDVPPTQLVPADLFKM